MTASNRLRRTVPALTLLGLSAALAACGSSGYGGSAPAAAPASTGPAAVGVASTSDGSVLVDGGGRTLYLLTSDAKDHSNCSGSCVASWPVASAATMHSNDVTATLGSLTRDDGTKQLTVNGMPAYTYAADQKSGDVNGQGITSFGGTWWVLSPAGTPITSSSSAPYMPGRY